MTVSSIKRRILEYGKSKRLGKRAKTIESNSSSLTTWLLGNYGKYVLLGACIIIFDHITDFRLEYLYTAGLLFTSCIDSYKYQGLRSIGGALSVLLYFLVVLLGAIFLSTQFSVIRLSLFTLLFVALVVYVDIFCLSLLSTAWLHCLASLYIWLQMIWQIDEPHPLLNGVYANYGVIVVIFVMLLPFLYYEMIFRFNQVPQYLLNISRPFASHCIGYPVVTFGFACKTYITCVIQQHHQRKVQIVNTFYSDLVTRALPKSMTVENPEESKDFVRPVEMQSKSDSPKLKEDADIPVGIKPTKSKGTAAGPKNTKSSSALSITKTKPASNVNKVQQPEMAAGTTVTVAATPLSVNTTKSKPVTPMVSPLQEAVPSHVVLTVEAVQPITTHVSGKKQAAVKAVPRAKLEGEELAKEQHVKSMNDALMADLEKERILRRENESLVYHLQMEVKQLKADLQASQLQEEESVSQKGQLASLEKNHRYDLQRLKAQNDTLTSKLLILSTSQTEDKAAIIDLERRLKKEVEARSRVDAELREHRHAITNAFTQEELAGLRKKVQEQHHEMEKMREQLKEQQRSWEHRHQREMEVLTASIQSLTVEKSKLIQENKQLSESLTDETKIKISLFSYLSEARRKEEATQEQLAWKTNEIAQLKHQMTQLLAVVPHTTAKPPPSP